MRLFLSLLLLTAGCKITSFKQGPPGRVITVRDYRFLTMTTATIEGIVNSNGVLTIKVHATSQPDTKALEAMAKGITSGILSALPVPLK